VVGFVGVGLDKGDGHQRLTRADHFVLLGGSEETHGHMQDVVVYFNETLQRRGKRLEETESQEALDRPARGPRPLTGSPGERGREPPECADSGGSRPPLALRS